MHKILNISAKILSYTLIIVGVVLCFLILMKSGTIATNTKLQSEILSPALILAIVAVCILVFVALILPLFFATYSKKKIIRGSLLIVGIVILIGIAWIMPDAKLSDEYLESVKQTEKVSRLVGTGCYLAYFAVIASIIALIYSGIVGFFKK